MTWGNFKQLVMAGYWALQMRPKSQWDTNQRSLRCQTPDWSQQNFLVVYGLVATYNLLHILIFLHPLKCENRPQLIGHIKEAMGQISRPRSWMDFKENYYCIDFLILRQEGDVVFCYSLNPLNCLFTFIPPSSQCACSYSEMNYI